MVEIADQPSPEVPAPPFTVLMPNPQRVYREFLAMEAIRRSKRLRRAIFPSGLFSNFGGQIMNVLKATIFYGHFEYNKDYIQQSYWPDDVAMLKSVLEKQANRRVSADQIPDISGEDIWWQLTLQGLEEEMKTAFTLGYRSERAN